MSKTSQSSMHGWKLWLVWNLVTDIGLVFALTILVFTAYFLASGSGVVGDQPSVIFELTISLVSGLLGGFFLGLFQWLVIESKIDRAWRWIWATSIGWAMLSSGVILLEFSLYSTPSIIRVVIMALGIMILGLAQWIVLRREVNNAGWWVAAYIIGFAGSSGIAPTMLESHDIFNIVLVLSPTLGIVTGFALLYLFKRPNTEAI